MKFNTKHLETIFFSFITMCGLFTSLMIVVHHFYIDNKVSIKDTLIQGIVFALITCIVVPKLSSVKKGQESDSSINHKKEKELSV